MAEEINRSALSLGERARFIEEFIANELSLAEAVRATDDYEKRVIDGVVSVAHSNPKVRRAVQEKVRHGYGVPLSDEDYDEIYFMTHGTRVPRERLSPPQQDLNNSAYFGQEVAEENILRTLSMHVTLHPGFDMHKRPYWQRGARA